MNKLETLEQEFYRLERSTIPALREVDSQLDSRVTRLENAQAKTDIDIKELKETAKSFSTEGLSKDIQSNRKNISMLQAQHNKLVGRVNKHDERLDGHDDKLNELFDNLINTHVNDSNSVWYKLFHHIFPKGFIYCSADPTNPSELFGGTWKSIKGRFIYAADETHAVDSTGGLDKVILNVAGLPAHNHSFTPSGSVSASQAAHSHSFTPSGSVSASQSVHSHSYTPSGSVSAHNHSFTPSGVVGGVISAHHHSFTPSGSINNAGKHKHRYSNIRGGGSNWSTALGATMGDSDTSEAGEHSHTFTGNTSVTDDASPSVTLTFSGSAGTTGNATPSFTGSTGTTGNATPSITASFTGSAGTTGNATPSITASFTGSAGTTGNAGNNVAHENMPPYISKYYWERLD